MKVKDRGIYIIFGMIYLLLLKFLFSAETSIKVYFSSFNIDDIQPAMLNDINNSTGEFKIAMYSFTNTSIREALCNRIASGSTVYLITDPTQAGSQYSQHDELQSCGGLVQTKKTGSSFMHHKYMIIKTTNTSIVWCGSYNWSSSSPNQDNSMIRMVGSDIVKDFESNFNAIWNK